MKKRGRRALRLCLLILSVLILLVAVDLYRSKYGLETSHYQIPSEKLNSSFRVVQLSDQHGTVFGAKNRRLVQRVAAESPDLILITGDIINQKALDLEAEMEHARDLIEQLTQIAPVYFSYGNHEIEFGDQIRQLFEEAGAIVLERDWVDLEVEGQAIRLGGIYGYCQIPPYAQETRRMDESEYVQSFQDTSRYSILMCHMPVAWLSSSLYGYDVNCVFAGHAHGGQVRIPWVGGLWAPDQGWFPGDESGVYVTSEETWKKVRQKISNWMEYTRSESSYDPMAVPYTRSFLVLSRGLGNTEKIPRFNNVPEIVVADFVPETENE